jgi:tetratricopeptide (TPR) repeat protein
MKAAAVLLFALGALLYAPTLGHGFLDLDDRRYVLDNPVVRQGIDARGVAWSFTTFTAGNWHPLTWLSHMLDVELFGTAPAGHHATNALLHGLNAALLFAVLAAMTGRAGESALVAALFAAHPLRVESVAWIAERKDLLCGLFWIATLGAWTRWTRAGGAARYLAVVAAFAAALLAKPMAVTLPFVLLLVDRWPLARSEPLGRRVVEKLPLFALAAAASAVTWLAQAESEFVAGLEVVSPGARAANALVAWLAYLAKTVWPVGLAIHYPRPDEAPWAKAALAALLLAAASAAAWRWRARRPALLTGWLWYVGTLVPVIGLVQVGSQAFADRYTYLPQIGIFLALAFEGWPPLVRSAGARAARALAAGVVAALSLATLLQLRHWSDGVTLFRHSLAVAGPSLTVEQALANTLFRLGRYEEAASAYRAALARAAEHPELTNGLAASLARLGRPAEAVPLYRATLARSPGLDHVRFNLALALVAAGEREQAIAELRRIVERDPRAGPARVELGLQLAALGRSEEGAEQLRAALASGQGLAGAPHAVRAHDALGVIALSAGRPAEAGEEFARALALAPGDAGLHFHMAAALLAQGLRDQARAELEQTLALDPSHAAAREQLNRLRPVR